MKKNFREFSKKVFKIFSSKKEGLSRVLKNFAQFPAENQRICPLMQANGAKTRILGNVGIKIWPKCQRIWPPASNICIRIAVYGMPEEAISIIV